eukprot:scaffold172268_cov23-Tisochrysis_lutea.AAC.2
MHQHTHLHPRPRACAHLPRIGSWANLPEEVEAEIVEIRTFQQDDASRRRWGRLSTEEGRCHQGACEQIRRLARRPSTTVSLDRHGSESHPERL